MRINGIERGSMTPEKQQEILRTIGSGILSNAPEGWDRIIFSTKSTVDMGTSIAIAEFKDGSTERFGAGTMAIISLGKLRTGMYVEGKGTWFSLEYTITRPGNFTVNYNYDEDPGLTFATDQAFTNDLKYFPRDPENIPGWLQERLREEAEGTDMR